MELVRIIFLSVATVVVVANQDANWKEVLKTFETYNEALAKAISRTKSLVKRTKPKCEMIPMYSDVIESDASPEQQFENCQFAYNTSVDEIRSRIKNKSFDRGPYNFEKYFPLIAEHCGCINPELKLLVTREKTPLLQIIYDLLKKIDSAKADWKKVKEVVDKFELDYHEKWKSLTSSLINDFEKVNKVYSECNNAWNGSSISKDAQNMLMTYTIFREKYKEFLMNCLDDLHDDDGDTATKIKSEMTDFLKKSKLSFHKEMGKLLPGDEWSKNGYAMDQIDWDKILETLKEFFNREREIFQMAKNNTKDETIKETYTSCWKQSFNPTGALNAIHGLINNVDEVGGRGPEPLLKSSFADWWTDTVLERIANCEGILNEEEFKLLEGKLTKLYDEFKKNDYKKIESQLLEENEVGPRMMEG